MNESKQTHDWKTIFPLLLTTLRLGLGPAAILLAQTGGPRFWFAPLLIGATLSDIFDGVIARRLGVARPWLRRYDSVTDLIYYLCIVIAMWVWAGDVMRASRVPPCLLAGAEVMCIIVSVARFGSMPATHCYTAKMYGLALFASFLLVLAFHLGARVFFMLTFFGLVADAEILAILLLAKKAPVDIPTVFQLKRREA